MFTAQAALLSTILFASSTLAAGIGSPFPDQCLEDCLSTVDLKGCGTTDSTCLCKTDYTVQAPLLKCVVNGCSDLEQANRAFGQYAFRCKDLNVGDGPSSTRAKSTSPTPKAAAPSFNLPVCAQPCTSKDTLKECANTPTPDCVVMSENDLLSLLKCALNSCEPKDASVAIYQTGVDTGLYSNQTAASDLPFPFNTFAAATSAPSSSASDAPLLQTVFQE